MAQRSEDERVEDEAEQRRERQCDDERGDDGESAIAEPYLGRPVRQVDPVALVSDERVPDALDDGQWVG